MDSWREAFENKNSWERSLKQKDQKYAEMRGADGAGIRETDAGVGRVRMTQISARLRR